MKSFGLSALISLAAISGCYAQEVGRASYYNYSRSGGFVAAHRTLPIGALVKVKDLIFTPDDDTLFSDFSFRGQLERSGFTGTIDVTWTDSSGTTGTIDFTGVKGPDADFDRLGIVSDDGETLKSVEISTPGSESFKEFKQVQFSAAGIPPSIPEPSTWAMMILGFAGLGFAGYRRARAGHTTL